MSLLSCFLDPFISAPTLPSIMQFLPVLVLALQSSMVYASPFPTANEKRDRDSYNDLFELAEDIFPGVWWYLAKRTCSEDQFKAIYEATSDLVGLIDAINEKAFGDEELGLSLGWNKFFMDGRIWQAVRCPEFQSPALLTVNNQQYLEEFSSMIGMKRTFGY